MNIVNISKPWGGFEQFVMNEKVTVKILIVKAGEAFSLQKHANRSEFWKVLEGNPTIQVGNKIEEAFVGDEFFINENELHRISVEAENQTPAKILEIAFGDFDESDIVRLEDKYGRV
ncbi:MAG: phosphomannose isomerase type II C-terminal cupin domain [bacterium]